MFEDKQLKSLCVGVTSYFQALSIASDIYEKKIQSMPPSRLAHKVRNRSFIETFANSCVYVTHFLKVYDFKVLSVEFLVNCVARVAAILCADNQRAVDIVIPVVVDKSKPDAGQHNLYCQAVEK